MIARCLAQAVSLLLAVGMTSFGADVLALPKVQKSGAAAAVTLDPVFDQSISKMKWQYGAFLYQERGSNALPPTFDTLDREGRLIASATLNVPGASSFWFNDYDRVPDGSIVFAGGTGIFSTDSVPFLAWISPDGKTQRVVNTAPYYPSTVSVAPDGTVWTVGYEMIDRDMKAPGLDPNASVLRHFDAMGSLIGSAIPQSRFRTEEQRRRLSFARIVATKDRIGWFTPGVGRGSYVEISTASMQEQAFPGLDASIADGASLKKLRLIESVTLTEDGVAYMKVFFDAGVYRLDRATSEWRPLQIANDEFAHGLRLLGADGEKLMFLAGQRAALFSLQ